MRYVKPFLVHEQLRGFVAMIRFSFFVDFINSYYVIIIICEYF